MVADFNFLQNKQTGKWVVSAPRRSHRTNVEKKVSVCPFCPGNEVEGEEVYRVDDKGDWKIRAISNKFPFAPFHELIIHSPDHHKNWDELPFSAVEMILATYKHRFNAHKNDGQTLIFHNRGHEAGESIPHPHTQLVVIPSKVKLDISPLDQQIYKKDHNLDFLETEYFFIFCPAAAEWPDEVWVVPKQNGGGFGLIKDSEITDLAFVLSRTVQIFDLRHGHEFPFNFYIAPLKNWYLRLIPRKKIIGGFELATNIIVNTQDPSETLNFIKEHFWEPDEERIRREHQADYIKKV